MLSTLVGVAFLSGCATVTPSAGHSRIFHPWRRSPAIDQGQTVRWGEKLIETHPEAHETCFTVLGEPLRRDGRPEPERGEAHIGRLLACAPGFYDPMLYRSGREITFIGRVRGPASGHRLATGDTRERQSSGLAQNDWEKQLQ